MRQDPGGVVGLARELSPGAEPGVRPSIRLVPGGNVADQAVESDAIRAIRPRPSGRLRRRTEWSPVVAIVLGLELVAATGVAAVGLASDRVSIALVALGWAGLQLAGTALGRSGRRVPAVSGSVKRAQAGAVAAVALVAVGLLGQLDAAAFLGLAAVSVVLRRGLRRLVRRRGAVRRTMVVGRSHELPQAVSALTGAGVDVTTYCVSDADELTRGEHLHRAILEGAPDRVMTLAGTLSSRELQELSWVIEDYEIDVVIGLAPGNLSARRLEPVGGDEIEGIRLLPRGGILADGVLGLAHRVAAAGLLAVIWPLMAAVALAVRLDSPGPVLFRQHRVGRAGVEFSMLKFRTMHVNAEEMLESLLAQNESEGGVLFKMKGDPRVTRVGRLLRATSLDELPQLVNVLRGEMALIGPRPALPREVAEYDHRARRRLAVRPGLTGLWQVSGRSNLSFEDAVRLDIDYVDNWSLRREAGIAARTFGAVARREGAY